MLAKKQLPPNKKAVLMSSNIKVLPNRQATTGYNFFELVLVSVGPVSLNNP